MTADQHTAIGRILGFPDCCVERWVESFGSGTALACLRGSINPGQRSEPFAQYVHGRISELLGRPWGYCSSGHPDDLEVVWVPCEACADLRDAGMKWAYNPLSHRYEPTGPVAPGPERTAVREAYALALGIVDDYFTFDTAARYING